MRIKLIQIDGALPNLALMKLAHWHRARGDEVLVTRRIEPDLFEGSFDRVYGSAIFRFSAERIARFLRCYPQGILGGTGTDNPLTVEEWLHVPSYEHYDYEGWDVAYSLGFTQRGCRLRCKFCLTPDSMVITAQGPRRIADIAVGERVLTHRGRYRRVLDVLSRPYQGTVLRLNSGAVSELFPTTVTAEHPVWTRRVSYRSGGQKLTAFGWLDAGAVKPGHPRRSRDRLAYPRTMETIAPSGGACPGAEWLPLNASTMTLVGWYLAEGYVTRSARRGYHQTTFCLGHCSREREYALEIEQAAAALGLKASSAHPSIGIRTIIHNVRFASWLVNQFGTGAAHKTIPLWVRWLPTDLLKPLLEAWAKGDGWKQIRKGTSTWAVTTVSPALAISLREIALKCGYAATINAHRSSDVIQGRKVRVRPGFTVIYHERRPRKCSTCADDAYVYGAVRESTSSYYNGQVYNLEVDEDHSYCTGAFALHNCVVPTKEGRNRSTNTIEEIWRGAPHPRHLHLLDNDFFGHPEPAWRARIDELRAGDFRVCLSQGINVRLITPEAAAALAQIEYRDTKFQERRLYTAWDNLNDERVFFRGIDRLSAAGIPEKHLMVYMLVGFDPQETWPRIWHRFNAMVERGIRPYPMVFDRSRADLRRFQRWVVTGLYRAVPWSEYLGSMRREKVARRPGRVTALESDLFGRAGSLADPS